VNSEINTGVAVRQNEEKIDEILGHEYEHEPVPAAARRSLFSVTMVWIGFPMIITGAMTGSILVLGMGFKSALIACGGGTPGRAVDGDEAFRSVASGRNIVSCDDT